jgi:acetoin utilization protein AcuB
MLVRDRMTEKPATVRPDSDPLAAQTLMRYGQFRRLPVVDKEGNLLGILSASDLDRFFSNAPSPGVVKRQYRVDQVMTQEIITVSPDYPLEAAAQLMTKHKVGALPVVEAEQLVGIITESDIFSHLVEALGGDIQSLRVTILVPDRPGQIARVSTQLAALNCNICSILSSPQGDELKLTMRLRGAARDQILHELCQLPNVKIVHVWPEEPQTISDDNVET